MRSMPLIKQLAHACIDAADLKKTEHFYCTALGLTKKYRYIRNGKELGFYLDSGGNTFIEVFEQPILESNTQHPLKHFCLQVENIDEVVTTLRSYGFQVSDKRAGLDRTWQCLTCDPNGINIELHQYTAESSQLTGRDCVIDSAPTKKS